MSYPSGRGMIFLIQSLVRVFLELVGGGLYLLGVYLIGDYTFGIIHPPSIFTYGPFWRPPRVRLFRVPLFFHSLLSPWVHISERFYYRYWYSNILQSREILLLDLGLYPRGFIYTSAVHLYLRSILTAGAPRVRLFRVPLFLTLYYPLGLWTPRDFVSYK